MDEWVNQWRQDGRLYVWRYADPRRSWRGWHFTADPAGCRSIRNLLDRMHGGPACHRTARIEPVTEKILNVPNFGKKTVGGFEKLRIEYVPEFDDLRLEPEAAMLTMTIGARRLRKLSAAFTEVEIGNGDFGIDTSDDRKSDPWMFWWMPDYNYHYGKRL